MIVEGTYPVSARKGADGWESPGISWDDYGRMSTHSHKQSGERRLPTPVWAVNDDLLQQVLVSFMEERAGYRKNQAGTLTARLARAVKAIIAHRPRQIATLTGLCKEYVQIKKLGLSPDTTDAQWNAARKQPYLTVADETKGLLFEEEARVDAENKRKRELEIQIEALDTYLRYTPDGGAGTIAAIVYLYYRAGLDSVGVGIELKLKPPHIRQILWRLYSTADRVLGPLQSKAKLGSASKDESAGGALPNQADANPETGDSSTGDGLAEPLFS